MKYYCKNKKNQNKTQTNGPNRMKLKLYFSGIKKNRILCRQNKKARTKSGDSNSGKHIR